MNKSILQLARLARETARELQLADSESKNKALQAMAQALIQHQAAILSANAQDLKNTEQPAAFMDRLTLNPQRIAAMAHSLEIIAKLPDPVGTVLTRITRPNGLRIEKISVPIGVIGVIYESRPNVTSDAAGLCFKAGNAVILRGGSESFHSAKAILTALHAALTASGFPITAVQMLPTTDRAAVQELLQLDKYIDVVIPRGGPQLIESIASISRIPLFKHLAGICHTYIHTAANLEMARNIVFNAKMRRTGICGATEVLLIDSNIVASHLPPLLSELLQAGCEVRAESLVKQLEPRVKLSVDSDYDTEFLAPIIAIKVVDNLAAAINHIAQHGTQHTDAIITEDHRAAAQFLKQVDSAIVLHNASTQFADGGEFGMGAEIGIATGKLHARGPVGVEQLTTFKYCVHGNGQIRAVE